jgi:hypothetical protein
VGTFEDQALRALDHVNVSLNEAAIVRLLESGEGPVARFVERTAEMVVEAAQQNVRTYFGNAPSLSVDRDVGLQMDGSSATVGIRDVGSKSRRLAQGQADRRINWLLGALDGTG